MAAHPVPDAAQSEDGVRAFFTDLHELYLKAMLCPFHTERTPIESPRFDQLVRASARRNL